MSAASPANPEAFEASAEAGLLPVAPAPALPAGRWRRYVHQRVAFSHCRVELPWFRFAGRTDPVSVLHRLALELDPHRPPAGQAGWRVAGALHALNAARQAMGYVRSPGGYVARTFGISRWRQLRASWTCLFRNNQLPRHYYERQLFNEPDPARWLHHLEHRQLTLLLHALNVRLPVTRLTNKLLFAEHCRAHGLPAPPTLAAWNGRGEPVVPRGDLPAADLFAKPFADYGGEGAICLVYDPARAGHVLEGEALAPDALAQKLAARAQGRGCLLQPRLRNAPANVPWLGDTDVANVRVVTGLHPGGAPRLLAAGLRVPSRLTTQGHDRTVLMAPIALGDGRLGLAYRRGKSKAGFTHHPDTGAPLAGAVLPRWPEMIRLALAAHATCPWLPFVGWDVVDSDRGLLLLEANAYWGANVVQMPGALPLGDTEFPQMYLAWHRHLGLPGGALYAGVS